ncbi:MAG: hypothetical protein K0S07_1040 [Chlamydiales bacterium]|jgi:hypothetical protein|nr:hypothetical protein [Chlamydiales bacterium]
MSIQEMSIQEMSTLRILTIITGISAAGPIMAMGQLAKRAIKVIKGSSFKIAQGFVYTAHKLFQASQKIWKQKEADPSFAPNKGRLFNLQKRLGQKSQSAFKGTTKNLLSLMILAIPLIGNGYTAYRIASDLMHNKV